MSRSALTFSTISPCPRHADADFRKAGEELLAFRLKFGNEMEENWGALFRTYPVEVRLWMRMGLRKMLPEISGLCSVRCVRHVERAEVIGVGEFNRVEMKCS